jgi:hypothetical protein
MSSVDDYAKVNDDYSKILLENKLLKEQNEILKENCLMYCQDNVLHWKKNEILKHEIINLKKTNECLMINDRFLNDDCKKLVIELKTKDKIIQKMSNMIISLNTKILKKK